MRRVHVAIWVAAFAAAACGGSSSTSPSQSVPTLHADVPDSVGDARPLAGLAVSPDLVHGTADVRSGSITFSIRLAPGTFDPSTTLVIIELDTDQSAATGRSDSDLGVDYLLSLGSGFGSQALVSQYVGTSATPNIVGNAPVIIVSDGMDVTVPLSMLGNDDGRMTFRAISYAHLPGLPTSAGLDWMPDFTLPGARVQ